jgi:hypothetical protein
MNLVPLVRQFSGMLLECENIRSLSSSCKNDASFTALKNRLNSIYNSAQILEDKILKKIPRGKPAPEPQKGWPSGKKAESCDKVQSLLKEWAVIDAEIDGLKFNPSNEKKTKTLQRLLSFTSSLLDGNGFSPVALEASKKHLRTLHAIFACAIKHLKRQPGFAKIRSKIIQLTRKIDAIGRTMTSDRDLEKNPFDVSTLKNQNPT